MPKPDTAAKVMHVCNKIRGCLVAISTATTSTPTITTSTSRFFAIASMMFSFILHETSYHRDLLFSLCVIEAEPKCLVILFLWVPYHTYTHTYTIYAKTLVNTKAPVW